MNTTHIQANTKLLEYAKEVFQIEIEAIRALAERLDSLFLQACQYFLDCKGRIIVLGLGKSGHIARKIAATFASTGSPSFFVHASEANHGDAGMITPQDVVFAISNSGKTVEIVSMLPLIKRLDVPFICLTGSPNSILAKAATIHLDVSVPKEACPLGLAPTASTTAALVMGDALAVALLEARGFTAQDFALSHPGGYLGRRLSLTVSDVMYQGTDIPKVYIDTPLNDVLLEMTQKSLGFTTVFDRQERLIGIYTDGDLRRTLQKNLDVYATPIQMVMTKNPKTISPNQLALEALDLMKFHKITSLCVTSERQELLGVLHIHPLLRANLI